MKRKSSKAPSAFANPVLIGAVTVLVIVVGMFLAYDANEDHTVEAVVFVPGADGKPAGGMYPYTPRLVKKGGTSAWE